MEGRGSRGALCAPGRGHPASPWRSPSPRLVEDPLAPTAVAGSAQGRSTTTSRTRWSGSSSRVDPPRPWTLADLGSGAGVPGAGARDRIAGDEGFSGPERLAEERVPRRARRRTPGTVNAVVVNARVETWPEGLAAFDVVTARALAPLPVVVEYAAPLLVVGGTLAVWREAEPRQSEDAGARAAAQLGLEPTEIRSICSPFPAAENRYLHLMSKVTETPLGFPRRPGMALKRPLGARSQLRHTERPGI